MKFDQEEMRRLAGRYFAGEIAAEEERELFRFVTSDAACRRQFAAWRLEWEAMPASDAATDRDWRRLRSRIRLQGSARSARPGRFAAVWRAAAAVAVVCATFFGARLYDRLLRPALGREAAVLPSTSPANAAWTLPRLIGAWGEALAPWLPR